MSEATALQRYPVRPKLRSGESLASYCARIYMLNGHVPISGIVGDSRVSARPVPSYFRSTVNALLGSTRAKGLYLRERQLMFGEGEHLLHWRVNATRRRFCPECMQSFGFHCLLWNLAYVTACPVHGCRLLEHCTACGLRLNWGRLHDFNCGCDLPIAAMDRLPASVSEIRFARAVAACDEFEDYSRQVRVVPPRRSWPRCKVDDLYAGINWVLDARNLLHRSTRLDILAARTPGNNAKIDKSPGKDVLCFVLGLPFAAHRAVRLLLPSAQFAGKSVLVDPRSDSVLGQLERSLRRTGQAQGRFTDWIASTIHTTLKRHTVPLTTNAIALYRPSLSMGQRQTLNSKLAKWWRMLIERLTVTAGTEPTLPYQLSLHFKLDMAGASGDVVRTLNLLFSIVKAGVPVDMCPTVIAHLRLSESMQSGRGKLADIAGALAALSPPEHAFLYELLLHDAVMSMPDDIAFRVWSGARNK